MLQPACHHRLVSRVVHLHLLRHAHAGDPEKWTGPDDLRPLSARGRAQVERLAEFLAQRRFRPDAILSSPKDRALETARAVGDALGLQVVVAGVLGEALTVEDVEGLLQAAHDPVRPLLVGHDPSFSGIAAELAGLDELPLPKGALVRIDLERPLAAGSGRLRWLVPPDLLDPTDRTG